MNRKNRKCPFCKDTWYDPKIGSNIQGSSCLYECMKCGKVGFIEDFLR